MSRRNVATIDIVKILGGVSFATLVAVGSASGNLLFAGLSALPAAILSASDTISTYIDKLQSNKQDMLELPVPQWWTSDTRSWQNVCVEISNHLPAVLQSMPERMRKESKIKTMDIVQQILSKPSALSILHGHSILEKREGLVNI
jgi:hypothetical protein